MAPQPSSRQAHANSYTPYPSSRPSGNAVASSSRQTLNTTPSIATSSASTVNPLRGIDVRHLGDDLTEMEIQYIRSDIYIGPAPPIPNLIYALEVRTHKSVANPKYKTGQRFEEGYLNSRCNEGLDGSGDLRLYGYIAKAIWQIERKWLYEGT